MAKPNRQPEAPPAVIAHADTPEAQAPAPEPEAVSVDAEPPAPEPAEDVSVDALQQTDAAALVQALVQAQAQAEQDAKAKRGERPAWQKARYDGPLDCNQAEWRMKHAADLAAEALADAGE